MYLFKVHKFDCAVWFVAFLTVMFLGLIDGLAISVCISLLIVLWESAYPHTAELGRLPGTTLYRNIEQYSEAERYDGLVIVRVDAPIYFANANNVRDKIRRYKRKAAEALEKQLQAQSDAAASALSSPSDLAPITTSIQYILLELSPVSRIDTTGLHMLEDMYTTQKQLKTQLCLCNPSVEVTARLVQSGLAEKLGRDHVFPSVIDAVQWCLHDMDSRQAEVGSTGYSNEPHVNSSNLDTAPGILAEEP
jgi:MFS superfamily sulfate permease-like transporter